MANIKSYPNNTNQYIGAEEVMQWHHGRTSGVYAGGTNCATTPVSGQMKVTVNDGEGWLTDANGRGITWWNDIEGTTGDKLTLNIDVADSLLNRIDRVIVEWTISQYDVVPEIKILKGTPSATASAPTLTNDLTVRQISLAQIAVNAGTTAITAAMITDERLDSSVCGLVTENVSADSSMILAQLQNSINDLNNAIQQARIQQLVDGAVTRTKLANDAYNTQSEIWSAAATYHKNYIAIYQNKLFVSKQSNNTNHLPTGSAYDSWWEESNLADLIRQKVTKGDYWTSAGQYSLWENSFYTESFAAQTISIPNLRYHNRVIIEYKLSNTEASPRKQVMVMRYGVFALDGVADTNGKSFYRNVTFNDYNQIIFGDCKFFNSYGTASTNNSYCIPIKIVVIAYD